MRLDRDRKAGIQLNEIEGTCRDFSMVERSIRGQLGARCASRSARWVSGIIALEMPLDVGYTHLEGQSVAPAPSEPR